MFPPPECTAGYSLNEVAKHFGVSRTTASKLLRKWQAAGGEVADLGAFLPTPTPASKRAKKFIPRVPEASFQQMYATLLKPTSTEAEQATVTHQPRKPRLIRHAEKAAARRIANGKARETLRALHKGGLDAARKAVQ
jgi:transposase-like protein